MNLRVFLPPLFALIALSGCEILGSSELPKAEEKSFGIQTDKDLYKATIIDFDYDLINIDISATFVNTLDIPVYFTGCSPPHLSSLQRMTGNSWIDAYQPVRELCLSTPARVLPGESIDLPSTISACMPHPRCGNEFRGPIHGTYRLFQQVYLDPDGKEPLPVPQRVSNPFQIVLGQTN